MISWKAIVLILLGSSFLPNRSESIDTDGAADGMDITSNTIDGVYMQREQQEKRLLQDYDLISGDLFFIFGRGTIRNFFNSLRSLWVTQICRYSFIPSFLSFGSPSCICTTEQLRNTIEGDVDERISTAFLCPGITIHVNEPFQVTGNDFSIRCLENYFTGKCTITASSDTQLFIGTPNNAILTGLRIVNGNSNTNGGAIELSSANEGLVRIIDCDFINNSANSNGGAIYIGPSARVQIRGTTTFNDNTATLGNDIYIASDDDPFQLGGTFVECVSSQTKFCDGLDGIVEQSTVLGVQAFDNTNCDTVATFSC